MSTVVCTPWACEMTAHADRTRRLVLLRHAKAEQDSRGPDALRALTEVGRQQSTWVGRALEAAGFVPELALVSSAVRTHQTWSHLADAFDPAPEPELRDELYGASPGTVLEVVRGVDERVRAVLVVGHEPTISRTASLLASEDSSPELLDRVTLGVPTATLVVLELSGPWSELDPRGARLVDVVVAPKH